METITFEQVEKSFHKWAGIFSNQFSRFEKWELINSAWLYGSIRLLPQAKIKYASARIKFDMIDYMRKETQYRRRKQREATGVLYNHLPYMFNFSYLDSIAANREVGENPFYIEDVLSYKGVVEIERRDLVDFIMNSIYMTRTEKLIMVLYYKESLSMKVVGKVCGLDETRISQIHSSLIVRLKEVNYSKAI